MPGQELVRQECGICGPVEDYARHMAEVHADTYPERRKRRRASRGVVLSERSEATDTATGAPAVQPFALVRQVVHRTGLGEARLTTRVRANPSLTPVDYFNELALLRERLLAIVDDLDGNTVWTVAGQIAVLALATEQAEVFAAAVREERVRSQIAAMREAAAQQRQRDQAADEAYVPPPLAERRRRTIR